MGDAGKAVTGTLSGIAGGLGMMFGMGPKPDRMAPLTTPEVDASTAVDAADLAAVRRQQRLLAMNTGRRGTMTTGPGGLGASPSQQKQQLGL